MSEPTPSCCASPLRLFTHWFGLSHFSTQSSFCWLMCIFRWKTISLPGETLHPLSLLQSPWKPPIQSQFLSHVIHFSSQVHCSPIDCKLQSRTLPSTCWGRESPFVIFPNQHCSLYIPLAMVKTQDPAKPQMAESIFTIHMVFTTTDIYFLG